MNSKSSIHKQGSVAKKHLHMEPLEQTQSIKKVVYSRTKRRDFLADWFESDEETNHHADKAKF
jgi:hypothetical protein